MTGKTAIHARRASPLSTGAEPRVSARVAAAIYFTLSLLYFLPALLPGRHIFGTDYLQAGFFFYDYVGTELHAGEIPGWLPYVFGGLPHFANPGSTYYPVLLLSAMAVSTQRLLPILFWIQFGVSGWGMYLLARELGCRSWVAFVAGLAWQWTGITASWVYAGHDGRIIVVTLAPMVFCMLHAAIRTGKVRYFAGAAAAIGCALLSFQIQNAYYLLVGAALWAVFCLVHLGVARRPAALARTAAFGLLAVGFAFAMAAVNFLPFRDYVSESPRGMTGGRGYEFSTSYSMPVRAIIGVAVPEQVGVTVSNVNGEYLFPVYRGENAFRLHTEYVGALVLILATLALVYARRNRYVWFFGGLGLFALSLALGGNTPLYRLYYAVLPGLKRFRAPDLAYYLLAFSLACIAAIGLEAVAAAREAAATRKPTARGSTDPGLAAVVWVGIGWAVFAVLGAVAIGGPSAAMAEGTVGLTPALGWMRFAVFAGLTAGTLWLWTTGRAPSRFALIALSVVTAADLWLIGKKFFQTVDAPATLYAMDDVAAFLKSQTEPGRILPLPGSGWPRFLDYPMYYDLELVGGEHGNNLQRYSDFVGTTPPAMLPDFHNLADLRFLAADNVRWLVAAQEINAPFLREAFRGASGIVYENVAALPRAYFVENVVRRPAETLAAMQDSSWDPRRTAFVEAAHDPPVGVGPLQAGARVVTHEPDRVEVRAQTSRAALMVLSDNFYKDWHATVDGRPTPIYLTNHTFRGVVVPAGTHTVRFTFEPKELYSGFWIYLATMATLLAYGAWLLVARRREAPAAAEAA
jgi:hypothetical protein